MLEGVVNRMSGLVVDVKRVCWRYNVSRCERGVIDVKRVC